MATFVTLVNFTGQGIQNVKDSPERFEAFKTLVEALGGALKSAYWTLGSYDMVVTLEGDQDAMMAALLKVGSLGNVTTQTLPAFSADEMGNFISKIP